MGERQMVTMVKKRLASGEPCPKCVQVEEMLRRRKVWQHIDVVVWADEADEESEGMALARRYGVKLAPFFVIEEGGELRIETSALKLAKQLAQASTTSTAASEAGASLERSVVENLAVELAGASPEKILARGLELLGPRCAIAFSGAEDVVLIDMAARLGHSFSVFSIDTGRLHPETYRYIDQVRRHYGIELSVHSAEPDLVEDLVRRKGLFSFIDDGHEECCRVRKVSTLCRVLEGYGGWVTGQRRDQSPSRADVPEALWDMSLCAGGMLKLNPLAGWELADVWRYIREHDVPYNELHDQGFVSIGCEPCSRPPRPGEHERAGRWWWEEATKRECGLHT